MGFTSCAWSRGRRATSSATLRTASAPAAACPTPGCSTDSGALNLDLTNLHVAVGGGLRYRTIVGTIRFGLGVRLNRLALVEGNLENPDPDQRVAFHISIGESF